MSAVGHFVLPFLVRPTVNLRAELLERVSAYKTAASHKSSWVQAESFTEWLQQFLSHPRPKKYDPVVVVLDGQYSRARTIQLLDLAKENVVHIGYLPPHYTNQIQPLDVSFMFPIEVYYAQEIDSWLRMKPTRVLTHC
jgi:hypothetical protein